MFALTRERLQRRWALRDIASGLKASYNEADSAALRVSELKSLWAGSFG